MQALSRCEVLGRLYDNSGVLVLTWSVENYIHPDSYHHHLLSVDSSVLTSWCMGLWCMGLCNCMQGALRALCWMLSWWP